MNKSIATIDSPQFINLQPIEINPLMSQCEIKVLYIGENRNGSYISKEVATEMAKTLRGAPIVGYYKDSKEDFADHGEKIIYDDEGIHFECMTKPYGFVSPDAKVWFQTFEDYDILGNGIKREYLMTNGYLWTGQFEECAEVLSGKPQSMELDENSLQGEWKSINNSNLELFIINDATFSKLCILGEDVEPCFEGAAVSAPEVSYNFSLDSNFKKTLFSMMEDLKKLSMEGESHMEEFTAQEEVSTEAVETTFEEAKAEEPISTFEEQPVQAEAPTEFTEQAEDASEEVSADFVKTEDKEEEEQEEDKKEDEEEEEKEDVTKHTCNHCLEADSKYSLLEEQYSTLQQEYSELQIKYDELVAFKAAIETNEKQELINSFSMLSEQEKEDVVTNIANYSYEEIDAKLSMIFAHKEMEKAQAQEAESGAVTYTLSEDSHNLPAWMEAAKAAEQNM